MVDGTAADEKAGPDWGPWAMRDQSVGHAYHKSICSASSLGATLYVQPLPPSPDRHLAKRMIVSPQLYHEKISALVAGT